MKLEEIAEKAQVSKSTVSLVLNGKPGVSEKKRAEILKIMTDSNYVRLRKKHVPKTADVPRIRFAAGINEDVISTDYQQPFFNELITYIFSEINAQGLSMTLSLFNKHTLFDDLKQKESEEPSAGIILLGTNLTTLFLKPICDYFDNLVVIDTESSQIDCNTITMNNFLGSYQAANYLLEMGHRRIGYIKGQPRINNFYDRRRGFKAALFSQHIDPKTLPQFHLPGMHIAPVKNHLDALLYFVQSVTAIFCENDYIALSLVKTLNQNGIRIPEDISIIGFDDIKESQVVQPELTTIHVPIKEIAEETVKIIKEGLENPGKTKKQIFFNPSLVIRHSVKEVQLQ
jgi:LacI family transcriptional regulator